MKTTTKSFWRSFPPNTYYVAVTVPKFSMDWIQPWIGLDCIALHRIGLDVSVNIQTGLDSIEFMTSWIELDWVSKNGPMSYFGLFC